MKFGSLFSGVGGFDLGFERAGMECVWQVEFDKACQLVLKKHWSETELFDDVRTVGKHNLKPVDVICGGFPCQDVSIAGKRAGLAGERSGLWSEFARIIDELEPKWVVVENVPGLLSSNKGRDFATVIRWLAERRYGVAWRILDSQYFGVAQRRRRVFIVGSFGNGSASEILFEREGVRWNTEKGRKTGEGIAGTFTVRTGKEGGGKGYLGLDDGAMTLGGQPQWVNQVANTLAGGSSKCHSDITSGQQDANVVVGALQARDYKGVGNQYVNEGKVITMSSGQANAEILSERRTSLTGLHEQPIVALNDQGGSQMSVTENVSATLRSQEHGHQPIVASTFTIRTGKAGGGKGYLGVDDGSMTLGGQPQWVASESVRRLTPTECERLQGFPDGWTDGQADSHRYKQMGNAVTVNVAEWIGKRIVGVNNDQRA